MNSSTRSGGASSAGGKADPTESNVSSTGPRRPSVNSNTSRASRETGRCSSRKRCHKWLKAKGKVHQRQFKDGVGHPFPWARSIIMTQAFENVLAFLIVLNCVFIGLQASEEGSELMLDLGEQFFTFSFFVDLLLRVLGYGWTWLLEKENFLDIFLVVMSVLVTWILVPLGASVELVRKLTVFRTLRMVRIARAVKMRPEMKEMWSLLKGLVDSTETLCWTYVMIGVLLYFFGILSTSLIAKQERFSDDDMVQTYFGDVPASMLTLFQIMTLDSWSSIVRELMDGGQVWIGCFFVVFITISQFVLMNLITAVIVENAFSDSKTEESELAARVAQRQAEEFEELSSIFKAMDEDGSGKLSREEMLSQSTKRKVRQKLRALDVLPKDLEQLWDILDDGDGELTAEEFTGGMKRLRGEAKSKDMLRLYRELEMLEGSIVVMTDDILASQDKMTNVRLHLQRTKMDITALQRTLARAKEAMKAAAMTQAVA
mmetsp:Transcript_70417/g.153537  ORF Transcript_70417/g.153537 Transcript_70417/m.153537 type:complete len:487 (-) Transcript_70417:377-1837(-)|eukprot:CAMPEP_0206429538 /NCGR_PEP_ID=MMETSP0324_2-20121206/6297_1 /ASSEMBLY_ACC=CAM_ASM_000836 /TAXON_ID=2866 /ORGANISM="Crypthecodinium cohnii, Strain Seligo" /LENGTH=486 /DNA_ID=CAMNT_0053895231 /DNA_START=9 /DNA_END=1469 /DNA_ORIENTATION=+